MQRHHEFKHLADDAFAKPVEVKKDYLKNYHHLYGEDKVIGEYSRLTEENATFKAQMLQLFDKFKSWGEEHKCEAGILNIIDEFKEKYFNEEYTGNQTPEFFRANKLNLEKIWFVLNFDKELSAEKKLKVYQGVCKAMGVCAPGFYTHLEDTVNSLLTEVSLERWLADFRTNLIRQFADKYVEENEIPEGDSIHVYNAFLVYALNAGFAPLSKVSEIADPFIAANTGIDETAVTNFFNYLYKSYSFKNVMSCIYTSFYSELSQFKKSLNIGEDEKSWFAYSSEYWKKVEELAQTIGLNEEDLVFFDQKDDFIHFNKNLFNTIFLKHCKDNSKLFNSLFWQQYDVSNKYHFITFNNKNFWCEDEKHKVVDYNEQSDLNAPLFLANLINHHSLKEFRSIKCFRKLINTPTKLGEFLASIPEKSKFGPVVDQYLGKKFLIKLIKNPQAIFQVLEKLEKDETWKISYLFSFKNIEDDNDMLFLKNIIKNSTPDEFRKLIELGVIPKTFDHAVTLPLLVSMYSDSAEKVKILAEYKLNLNGATMEGGEDKENRQLFPALLAASKGNFATLKELIHQGADITGLEDDKDIAYHIIKKAYKNPEKAKEILTMLVESKITLDNRPFDFNYKDSRGDSLIFHAAEHGNLDMMKFLVEKGVDLQQVDNNGRTLVHAALRASRNTKEILEFLAGKLDFNKANHDGETPIHTVAAYHLWSFKDCEKENKSTIDRQRVLLQILVKNNANPNVVCNRGKTPLFTAINNDNAEIIKTLCELKADVNNNALHYACSYRGKPKMVKVLVECKADMYLKLQDGRTPVRYALNSGAYTSIETLFECGLDIHRQDSQGRTLLHYVVQKSEDKERHYDQRIFAFHILNYLIDNKADLYQPDKNGLTPLHFALLDGESDHTIKQTLLKRNVDFLRPNPQGISPVMMAAEKDEWYIWSKIEEVLKINSRHPEPWRFCSDFNLPLLHAAVHLNNVEAIRIIAESKAIDLNQKSRLGFTALDMAKAEGNTKMIKVLLQYGADPNKSELKIINTNEATWPQEIAIARKLKLKNMDKLTKCCQEFNVPLLHAAIYTHDVEAVKILAENKAVDFTRQNILGITPAQAAVMFSGYSYMSQTLLSYGVDFMRPQGASGKSPLSLAMEMNNLSVAAEILGIDTSHLRYPQNKEAIMQKMKELEEANIKRNTPAPLQNKEDAVTRIMDYKDAKDEAPPNGALKQKTAPEKIPVESSYTKSIIGGATLFGIFALKILSNANYFGPPTRRI